jgi:nucleoid DNA-binding protein
MLSIAFDCDMATADRRMRTMMSLVLHHTERHGRLIVPGFGVFFIKKTKPRTVVMPGGNAPISARGTESLSFKAAKGLRRRVDVGDDGRD